MEQAAKFAETTQILMNVSEFTDVSQATDTLISAVQAFGYTAETSMDVVDLLNTIGNNYAISTADLAQSLTKSSASLVAAGGDLAEAAALTATANKIIQDADSVGTALKTTSLRLRGTDVKVLEEEGLDSEGAVTSKSKLQSKVKAISGVDILTATGEYKSTYEILSEIADVWEKIDDMDQAALLELISGKRNSSVIAAILQNPEELKEAFEDANNASGSALKENEKYLDSIQGKIDQFNNAVQSMWSDTLDSDVVKFFVDLATQLVKIVDAVGPVNIAIVGLFAYLEKQHGIFDNLFKPASDGLEELKKQLEKAEQDLTKAEEADLRRGTDKTAEKRRNAEERVNILRQKVQEASEEAVLEGIDESFDPLKAKNSLRGKKGARTKRINKLQAEGKTFDEIQADPQIQQYTRDIEEAERALNEYNETVGQTNITVQQASAATRENTDANQANAASNMASASAETADATATAADAAAIQAKTVAEMASTSTTWADFLAVLAHKDATLADVAVAWNKVAVTKLLNTTLGQYILQLAGATAAEAANMTMGQLLSLGLKGLGKAFLSAASKAITFIVSLGPIAWAVMAIAAAITIAIVAFSAMHKTTEELQEELDDFKSKLSDIESELNSVNQELETTNKRMEELLAKDKLTFEEQEELDRLRETNDELERRKQLLEDEKEYKEGLVGRQAARVVDSAKDHVRFWQLRFGETDEEKANREIDDYRKLKEKYDNAITLQQQNSYKEQMDKKAAEIDEYIATLSEALDGVEYGDSDESDKALDYLAELQDTYGIARSSAGAKTNAIKGIMKKDEFSSMSKAIDYYVEALKDGDESAADAIAEIINDNDDFVEDLEARGLKAQDAIDLYTQLGSDLNFGTLEGKIAELKRTTDQLPNALNNIKQFIDGDEVDTAAIAEYFKGTSAETREEIAKLIQQIKNGEISVENALKQFELFGVQSTLKIEITEVQSNFKDVFTDLEDADGLIDTFNELADAIGSTSGALDALNAAQAEMEASGRVSIETALKLMEYTDDYSKVLTISEGKVVLAENAEENLIDARIEGMKASALKALEEAKAARETTVLARSNAETALSTYNSAIETEMAAAVTATAWDKVLASAAGLLAGIKSLFTDESWTEAYDRAYQETLNSLSGDRVAEVQNKYASAEEQAKKAQLEKDIENANKTIEEQDKEIEKLQGNSDLINGLNKDNIGDVFKSDGFDNPDDVKDDRFQKEMDYWENRIAANQAMYEQLQNEIDLLESKGQKADASFYEEQIKLENERKWLLEQQRAAAQAHLATLEEGSEEWWEVANTLNDIEGELDDVTASIVYLQDAIAEIDTYKLEEFSNRLDNLTSKLETIRNLIAPDGEEDWFDDEGNWTESGVAVLGSYLQELETYKQGYAETVDELNKYAASYEGNETYYETLGIHSEQEWYDKTEELISQQYDFAESISDTKQSVADMYKSSIDAVEEYVDTLIDGYNDYIDSVKEALDAERDLYDFKKNVQKQAKDIAEIERRIASLSGSTNAADIAERRKLEAQLYESRESLNDTYYDHAKDSQNEALDAEQTAYEESMTKFVEGLRVSLEEATANMDEFLMGVTSMVMYNADTVLTKYQETNLPLTDELTNPWEEAKKATSSYSGNALDLMNKWTKEGGFFSQFNSTGTKNLESPWNAGATAANTFKDSVYTAMTGVVSTIESNVKKAKESLSSLTDVITTTNIKADGTVGTNYSGSTWSGNTGGVYQVSTQTMHENGKSGSMIRIGNKTDAKDSNKITVGGKQYYKHTDGYYYPMSAFGYVTKDVDEYGKKSSVYGFPAGTKRYEYYANGTTGTSRDQWALTDEPRFGDELVLVPGKDGNLSFMRKGTGVVPADLTANLMEWGQFTPDAMNLGGGVNVNMINNAVNKPEFNFAFDALVKAENITEETLPAVKKLVTQELNRFTKELNYALKGKGAR